MKKLIIASLGFVLVYNLLFFDINLGLGTGFFFLFLNLFYFSIKGRQSNNLSLALISSVSSVAFAFLVGFRANEIFQVINLFLASFFSFCSLYFYKGERKFSFQIPKFILIPLKVAIDTALNFSRLLTIGKISKNENSNQLISSIIRGLVIAIPLFIILLLLLTHADPVFNKLVGDLFENIWRRIFFSALIFIGLISFGLSKFKDEYVQAEESLVRHDKTYELFIIVSSLVSLFAVFLVVQVRYFFSGIGERELQQLGIASLTYSEYVRKGFFELLAAAAVAGLTITYIMRYIHKLKDNHKFWMQIISSSLIAEIGFVILSAAQRINLYQAVHGLTRARILGFIFLVWLGIMLVILLINILKNVRRELLFNLILFSSLIILLIANIIDVDGLIASKYRPSVNGEVDYYYLLNISPDAYISWTDAFLDSKRIIERLYLVKSLSKEDYRQLYWASNTLYRMESQVNYLSHKYGSYQKFLDGIKNDNEESKKKAIKKVNRMRKWQSFNLGEYKAYQYILQNREVFDKLSDFVRKAEMLNNNVGDEVRNNTPLDRSTEPPLI